MRHAIGERMKISKAEEQALRLVLAMTRQGSQVTLGELSEVENIPEPTVAKLLARMRSGAVVVALRGRNGGYELARAPAEITVADVILALGKPLLDGIDCETTNSKGERCPNSADCGLRSVWNHLELRISSVLTGTTLADLVREESQVAVHLSNLWPGARDDRGAGSRSSNASTSEELS